MNSISLSFHLSDGTLVQLNNFTNEDISEIFIIEKEVSVYPWRERDFIQSVNSSHICVGLQHQNRWIAYAVFSKAAEESELLILGVAKSFQNKGCASLLMEQMEKRLQTSVSEMFLEVRASNIKAINFYEKQGFSCLGERENYYPCREKPNARENALIYGKHIQLIL